MTRLLYLLYFLPVGFASAQGVHEPAPTTYTEPAGIASVVVFLLLFFGSIVLYGVWIWYRHKKQKQDR